MSLQITIPHASKSSCDVLGIPEILYSICTYLPYKDILSLKYTGKSIYMEIENYQYLWKALCDRDVDTLHLPKEGNQVKGLYISTSKGPQTPPRVREERVGHRFPLLNNWKKTYQLLHHYYFLKVIVRLQLPQINTPTSPRSSGFLFSLKDSKTIEYHTTRTRIPYAFSENTCFAIQDNHQELDHIYESYILPNYLSNMLKHNQSFSMISLASSDQFAFQPFEGLQLHSGILLKVISHLFHHIEYPAIMTISMALLCEEQDCYDMLSIQPTKKSDHASLKSLMINKMDFAERAIGTGLRNYRTVKRLVQPTYSRLWIAVHTEKCSSLLDNLEASQLQTASVYFHLFDAYQPAIQTIIRRELFEPTKVPLIPNQVATPLSPMQLFLPGVSPVVLLSLEQRSPIQKSMLHAFCKLNDKGCVPKMASKPKATNMSTITTAIMKLGRQRFAVFGSPRGYSKDEFVVKSVREEKLAEKIDQLYDKFIGV